MGQDGKYLCEYLENLNYDVYGIDNGKSIHTIQKRDGKKIYNVGVESGPSVLKIIKEIKPDEIYNLAALHRAEHQSKKNNIFSFMKTNTTGVLNILEACRKESPGTKVFQAGSSEVFGNSFDEDGTQRLTTPMRPVNLYGCTKLLAYNLIQYYRSAHNIFACVGILYNHESPQRDEKFVTTKIVKTAVEIKRGIKNKLELGNIDVGRDWGHAKDYVRAMHMILGYKAPRDWIIATGETKTIREVCSYVFSKMGLDYKNHIVKNSSFVRTEFEKTPSSKDAEIKNLLGWRPSYDFHMMLDEMIKYWDKRVV